MSNDEPLTLKDVALAAIVKNGGATGRELGRIAESKGLTLSYTTVNKIVEGTYKSKPKRETLEALAALSGQPLEVVYRVAKLPLPLRPLRDDLPPDSDLLDASQRRVVIDVVRLFAQQNRHLAALQSERERGEEHADAGSPAITTPDPGPADQPGQDDYGLAARDVKDRRALEAGELETAQAGEPEPDNADDVEPR